MADAAGATGEAPGQREGGLSVFGRVRRYLALAELIVFAGPVVLFCAEGIFFYVIGPLARADRATMPPIDLPAYFIQLGRLLVVVACLVAGVRIVVAFVDVGHAKLRRVAAGWWVLASAGVLLSTISLVSWPFTAGMNGVAMPWVRGWLPGFPAVVPMLHMYIERGLAARDR